MFSAAERRSAWTKLADSVHLCVARAFAIGKNNMYAPWILFLYPAGYDFLASFLRSMSLCQRHFTERNMYIRPYIPRIVPHPGPPKQSHKQSKTKPHPGPPKIRWSDE